MEVFRKTLGSIFLPTGFHRSLLLATYDDKLAPDECEIEILIQGLLGCDSKVNGATATELLLQRLKENWTWTVVLKVLVILHRLINRTTKQWLREFLQNINTFKICQSFREGEGTDRQAQSHTKVVRKYSQYLLLLSGELIKPNPLYDKDSKFDKNTFKVKDEEEIFRLSQFYSNLIESCLSPFMSGTSFVEIDGFCELSAFVALSLIKDGLHIYSVASIIGLELLDRFPNLHPCDVEMAEKSYESYRISSDRIQGFLDFIKKFPRVGHLPIPQIQTPPAAPALSDASKRSRFAIDSSSSDSIDRSTHRRRNKHRHSGNNSKQQQIQLAVAQSTTESLNGKSGRSDSSSKASDSTKGDHRKHRKKHRIKRSSSSSSSSSSRQNRSRKNKTSIDSRKSSITKERKRSESQKLLSEYDSKNVQNTRKTSSTDKPDNFVIESTHLMFDNNTKDSTNIKSFIDFSSDEEYKKVGTIKPIQELPLSSTISSIPLPVYPHPTNLSIPDAHCSSSVQSPTRNSSTANSILTEDSIPDDAHQTDTTAQGFTKHEMGDTWDWLNAQSEITPASNNDNINDLLLL